MFKRAGDRVRRPLENVDRIGYVMTAGNSSVQAERMAEDWISECAIKYK